VAEEEVAPTPKLSVVVASREGYGPVAHVVEALLPQLDAVDGELVGVGPGRGPEPSYARVRWIGVDDGNILALRRRGVEATRAPVVAIGEDHAVPAADWCEAVLRAHADHPEAAAVVGCLVNATSATTNGRANFYAFAAPFEPPMPSLPARPPPISALSFKRPVLDEIAGEGNDGMLESVLVPRLFAEGAMVADDRIVVEHFQDHGLRWSVTNAFASTRANYGYANLTTDRETKQGTIRWITRHLFLRQWREAWSKRRLMDGIGDAPGVAAICASTTFGAVVGTLFGPGAAAARVA